MPDDISIGEIGRSMYRVENELSEIKADLKANQMLYVTREQLDDVKTGLGREIGTLRQSIEKTDKRIDDQQTRTPVWPAVAMVFLGVCTLLIALIALLQP